jgi:hypothetical protein
LDHTPVARTRQSVSILRPDAVLQPDRAALDGVIGEPAGQPPGIGHMLPERLQQRDAAVQPDLRFHLQ